MSDVIQEMGKHVPDSFFWLKIFLAANMTEPSLNYSAAIQTISFFSQRSMAHP